MTIKALSFLTALALHGICAAEPTVVYGDPMPTGEAIAIEAALNDPASYSGRLAKFQGRITEVCQKKGCWAIMTDGTTAVRVKFEDHDNALPFSATGTAVVFGRWQTKRVSEKLAKHYATDAGDDPSGARAGKEHQILAHSIQLLDGVVAKSD